MIDVEIVNLAKSFVGKARWKYLADLKDAPEFFDCSSLISWLLMEKGIVVPRHAFQQFSYCCSTGKEITSIDDLKLADLIFTTTPYWKGEYSSMQREFGHVCIMSGHGEIICATNSELGKGVVKMELARLFATRKFCGAGRIL